MDFIKGDHTGLICGSFTYGFTFNALERVINLKDDCDTEMMWVYFTETGIFKIEELQNVPDSFYRDDIRMTLDYKEDLDFFVREKCFASFDFKNHCFYTAAERKLIWNARWA